MPMSAAPTSLPPPSNAARTWIKALNLLSPTTLFRTKKQLQESRAASDATKPPMPVHVLDTLAQLVDYLEENHRREEGLYRRESSMLEWGELKQSCLNRGHEETVRLPDLATLSPHSVTKVIKEILGNEFEPIVPYTVSQTLLDRVAQCDEITTLTEIVDKIKLLTAAKRDFLKVFLIHLHHISTSIPCRMTAKQLATHVGVLLIRPTEERHALSSKDLFKQRRQLTQLMIEHASALPYDSQSQLNQGIIPNAEPKAPSLSETPPQKPTNEGATVLNPKPTEPVHYIQAMWDASAYPQTEESLHALLSPFGSIATLAINDSGSRAIIAFSTSDGAQAAAEAHLPNVRIRRRRPRSQPLGSLSSSAEYPPSTPAQSPTEENDHKLFETMPVAIQSTTTTSKRVDVVPYSADDAGEIPVVAENAVAPTSPESANSSPGESPRFLHKLERPPSRLLVEKAMKTSRGRDEIKLEDIESLPTSPQQLQVTDNSKTLDAVIEEPVVVERNDDELDEVVEPVKQPQMQPDKLQDSAQISRRKSSLKNLLKVNTALNRKRDSDHPRPSQEGSTKLLSPSSSSTIGFISDLKSRMSKVRTPRAVNETREAAPPVNIKETPHKETRSVAVSATLAHHSKLTQTKPTTQHVQDRETDTDDLPPPEAATDQITSPSANEADKRREQLTGQVVVLEQCLRDVQSELEKLAAALGATKRIDVDRAILQAHERLALAIDQTLTALSTSATASDHIPAQGRVDVCQATREFVLFLETRSSTQVKILEAEVRAGQELLRLHRSQHQKEIAELETEIASLRVTGTETEKMCAELRRELRQCRNELTCHVASAASIQRDRRDVEEKLIISENKLRAKEQELLTLQLAHDEMREVAAKAQMRLDEHRGAASVKQETESSRLSTQRKETSGSMLIPRTTAFLDKHRKPTESLRVDVKWGKERPSRLVPGQYSNTTELAAMQSQLQQRIQAQIETTKASLKEMQQFDTKRLFVDEDDNDEDEADLEQLEQQLASVQAEMDAAMDESRQKLHELLEPSPTSNQPHRSSFDPSGLVEGLLAKALSDDWDGELNSGYHTEREREHHRSHGPLKASPRGHDAGDSHQSELYKRWLRDRAAETRRGAATKATAANQDNSKLREAQESMQRFQQALASMTTATAQRQ